jgi:hypothetical protein
MITGREGADSETWFYAEIVSPTVVEYLTQRDSVRRGVLACVALANMANHYFHARQPVASLRNFRTELRKNGAFRLVEDVANGTKHVKRGTRSNDKHLGFEDIGAQEINFGNLRCGWPFHGTEVMVEDDGNLWLLSQLVTAADEMWRNKLANRDLTAGNVDPLSKGYGSGP